MAQDSYFSSPTDSVFTLPSYTTDDLLENVIAEPTKLQEKQSAIAGNTLVKMKSATGKFKADTLIGLNDADSLITENLGGGRSGIPETKFAYDAIELDHGNKRAKDAILANRYKRDIQPHQAAAITGKRIEDLTNQDYLDVGNMQQVQKLSDAARSEGQDRWQAPYVPNVGQINLTGYYPNDQGIDPNIPLNIPIETSVFDTSHGRQVFETRNPETGINITREATNDPRLNAVLFQEGGNQPRQKQAYQTYDTDEVFGESVDIAQAGLAKLGADAVNALEKGTETLIGKENVDAYNDWATTVTKYFDGKEAGIVMDKDGNFKSDNILGLQGNIKDSRNKTVADEKFGVQKATRAEQSALNAQAETHIANGDYIKAAIPILKNLPYMLGDSAAETAIIMVPGVGIMSAVGVRVSNQAEEFEENNGRAPTTQELAQMVATNTLVLGAERFIVKAGIKNVTEGITKGNKLGKRALGVAGSTAFEGVQELADYTQETYNVQKKGEKTVEEIATSPTAQLSGLSGAAAGGALRGTGETLGAVKDAVTSKQFKERQQKRIDALVAKKKKQKEAELNPLKVDRTETQQKDAADLKAKNLKTLTGALTKMDSFDMNQLKKVYDNLSKMNDDSDIDVINKMQEVKASLSKALSTKTSTKPEEDIKLGSEAEAEVFIEELFLYSEDIDNTILNENVNKVAQQYNISEKRVKELKSAAQVEFEVSKGHRGYQSYDRDLKRLLVDPEKNVDRIEATKEKLYNLENTQINKLQKLKTAVTNIEKNLKDKNQPDGQVPVTYSPGYSYKVNIKNGKINEATYKLIGNIEATIQNINKIYDTHGLDKTNEFDLQTQIHIPADPGKSKKGKGQSNTRGKAIKKIMKQLDNGQIIYMKHRNERKKGSWDSKVAMPLYRSKDAEGNRKYVEVDKDGDIQPGSGRWTLASKANPAKKNTHPVDSKTEFIARKVINKENLTEDEQDYHDKFKKEIDYEIADLKATESKSIEDVIVDKRLEGKRLNTYEQKYYEARALDIDAKVVDAKQSKKDSNTKKQKFTPGQVLRKAKELLERTEARLKEVRADLKKDPKNQTLKDKRAALLKSQKNYKKQISKSLEKKQSEEILDETIGKNQAAKSHSAHKYNQEVDPNKIVTATGESANMINSIGINYKEMPKTSELMVATRKAIRKALAAVQRVNKGEGRIAKTEYSFALMDSPSRGLIYDEFGEINETTMAALGVALEEYIATGGMALGAKSVADIARMLDKKDYEVGENVFEYFKDKGIYTKEAAYDIGKATLRILGMKENPNIAEEVYYKLVADLGQVGLISGIDRGLLEYTSETTTAEGKTTTKEGVNIIKHNLMAMDPVDAKEANAILSNVGDQNARVSFVRFTKKGKEYVSEAKLNFEEVQEETGVDSNYEKGPLDYPVTTDDISIRNNDVTKQAPKATKTLNKLRNFEFEVDPEDIGWLQRNREVALLHLGWKSEEDLVKMSFNNRLSAEAKNEVLERSLEFLNDLDKTNMYFDWFYSKNGRYMLDSNTVNPQTDKLHRFLINIKKHRIKTDISSDNNVNTDGSLTERGLFSFSIAQAFGMSTDKRATTAVLEFGDKVLKMDPDHLLEMLEKNNFTDDIEMEHLGHYIQGVHAVRAYKDAYDNHLPNFTHNLSMESDAVTSGFGLKLMQMPILGKTIEKTYEWLARTGFFVNQKVTSMNDEVAKDDFFDSYQTLARRVTPQGAVDALKADEKGWGSIKKMKVNNILPAFTDVLPKPDVLEDGTHVVSKALRELFKDPFMTFNYSRGLSSIKTGLGGIIANDIMNQLVQEDITTEQARLLKQLEVIYGKTVDGKSLVERIKTLDPEKIMPTPNSKTKLGYFLSLNSFLNAAARETYGRQATDILGEEFNEFSQANTVINNSFKAMFQIYSAEYKEKKAALEKKNEGGLTSLQKLELIQSLRKKFPLINGPFSTDKELSDAIVIVGSTNRVPNYQYGSASTHLADGKRKKVQSKIRELEEAMSAGAVIPIHYIDGAIMGNTILDSKGSILGIHDAIIPGLDTLVNDVINYNNDAVTSNKQYSITQEVYNSLVRVAEGKKGFKLDIFEGPETIDGMIAEMHTLNSQVQLRRDELYAQDMDVVHMSAVPGSKGQYQGIKSTQAIPSPVKPPKHKNVVSAIQAAAIKDVLFTKNGKLKSAIQSFVNSKSNNRKIKTYLSTGDVGLLAEVLIEQKKGDQQYVKKLNDIVSPPKETTVGSEENTGTFETDSDNLRINALKTTQGMKDIVESLDDTNVDAGYKKYVLSLIDTIDPKFIPELNVYINSDQGKNRGQVSNTEMIIDTSVKDLMQTGEMSATEVFAHELMHAISKFAIERQKEVPEVRRIIRQIEALRDLAEIHISPNTLMVKNPLDKKAELKLAQDRYDYIFNSKNSLHEFIAHGLTNVRFKKQLEKVQTKDDSATSLWDAIKTAVKRLLDLVLGNTNFQTTKGTIRDELHQLTFELMESNNKAVYSSEKNSPLLRSVNRFVDRFGNKPLIAIIDKASEIVSGDPEKFPTKPENGTMIQNGVWAIKFLIRFNTDPIHRGTRESALSALGMKPEGFIQNIIRDFQTPDDLERTIEQHGLDSDKIDRAREAIVKGTRENIHDEFGRPLEKYEEEAITLSGLDLDIAAIYDEYTPLQLSKLYDNPELLKKEISKVKTQLARLDRKNFNWNNAQSIGLGYYLATHKAGPAQNLNATNIARGVLSGDRIKPSLKVIKKIDQLSTLIGISHSPEASNKILGKMITSDKKGIEYIVRLSKGIKQESQKQLFDSNTQMIKGYTKELFDHSVEITIRPLADEDKMNGIGFELVQELTPSTSTGDTQTTMGIYKAKFYVNNSYHRTATRMTNMVKKGTSLLDIENAKKDGLGDLRAKKKKKELQKKTLKIAEQMKEGTYTVDPTGNITPIVDQWGNISGYRYTMSKEDKKKYLNQDTTAPEVLGRTLASITDKVDTAALNDIILDTIFTDMQKNYDPTSFLGKNGMEYIPITPQNKDPKIQEIYRILPPEMKTKMKKHPLGHIAVRRDMLHNYFGFRDATLTDFLGIHRITPKLFRQWIKVAEAMWQDIVSISKVDIIIRTPVVFIGNVISNFMYSVVMGINPLRVAKMQLDNMRNTIKYIDNQEKLARLESKLVTKKTPALEGQIKRIKNEQTKNPVHDLMEAGMYQAIVEDVNKRELRSSNRLVRRVGESKIVENVPEYIRQGANWLYLTENTSAFAFMTKATQYSDFIARATEYQIQRERGVSKKKALTNVLDVFINYGKPASSFEEYLNQMGFVMFTKYAKRIQRVIATSGKEKPANILLSILGQELFMGIDDIWDQHPFVRSYANIGISPWEHLERAYTPTALQFVGIFD